MSLLKSCIYGLSRSLAKPLVSPELLILSLTDCCNLKCITCNIKREADKELLRVDTAKIFDIVRQAKGMKIKTVVLSGGEPFLVKEIFEIAEYIQKQGMSSSVTTNGAYGEEMARRIALSKINHIHFSCDGLAAGNDEIRGQGSYDRLIRTVKLIRQLNPDKSIGFGCVVCSRNCNDLFEMTMVADDLGVNSINFIPFLANNIDPQHSSKGHQHHYLWPDENNLADLERNLRKISGHKYRRLDISPSPDFRLLLDYYRLKPIRKKCFAGYKSVIITASRMHEGRMVSDVFFCQDSCGNIYDTTLKEAWNSLKAKDMRLKARACNNPCLQFCHYI